MSQVVKASLVYPAILLAACASAGQVSDTTSMHENPALDECTGLPTLDMKDWVNVRVQFHDLPRATGVRGTWPPDFSLSMPSCFEEFDRGVLYLHGGRSWRCGEAVLEVSFGYWGTNSFGSLKLCRTRLNGIQAIVARDFEDRVFITLVWYDLETAGLEPVVQAWSPNETDLSILERVVHSGLFSQRQ